MSSDDSNPWKIYRGNGNEPHDGIERLPAPPPWRSFEKRDERRGRTFQPQGQEVELVNAALYLRRPILITGPPGSGKTSLAYAVAHELKLGSVLRWSINSKSTVEDGLYHYDALARLRDLQGNESGSKSAEDVGRYIKLRALGTAFLCTERPRVLLIDEIDKADLDLPNDLLHIFEEGEFEIPELVRIAEENPEVAVLHEDSRGPADRVDIPKGRVSCQEFPFVVITSNGERELSPAFQRRCLRFDIDTPDSEHLKRIVKAHLGSVDAERLEELVTAFCDRRDDEGHLLATDQLLNAVFLLAGQNAPGQSERELLSEILLRELEHR